MQETLVHGTCVILGGAGVLIEGPPGAGKSDLALRLMDEPGFGHGQKLLKCELVADDQILITRRGDDLEARSPESIRGRLEIRGLDIVSVKTAHQARLNLAVRLSAADTIDRLPDLPALSRDLLGIRLPLVFIDPRQASAAARLRAAVVHLLEPLGA